LPIVYVCQHNGWAISQAAPTYLPGSVAARATGYGIAGTCVDGNDVEAVRLAVGTAVERARAGAGPSLVEARTWRWRGHWAADAQAYRASSTELVGVEDPLDLYAFRLLDRGAATLEQLQDIHDQVTAEVRTAVARAAAEPNAGASELGLEEVFAP
jgi:pyruvate dehydrogenase E1 component alpha subunit